MGAQTALTGTPRQAAQGASRWLLIRWPGFPRSCRSSHRPSGANTPAFSTWTGTAETKSCCRRSRARRGACSFVCSCGRRTGWREVSAAGESPHSARREALAYGGADWSGFESFEFIVGGSAGFGGGLRWANVDSDAERELLLRFYRYASDPAYYRVTEAAYDLDQAQATERSTETETVPAEAVDDSFRNLTCDAG